MNHLCVWCIRKCLKDDADRLTRNRELVLRSKGGQRKEYFLEIKAAENGCLFFILNVRKNEVYRMKRIEWKRFLSGLLSAVTIACNIASPLNAYASESVPNVSSYPYYEEIKDYLNADEVVVAKDYEILAGTSFDVENDFSGLEGIDEGKVTVRLQEAKNASGEAFDSNQADTYHTVYLVEPVSKNPTYQISRNLVVKEGEESRSLANQTETVSPVKQEEEQAGEETESALQTKETEGFVLSDDVAETMPEEIADKVVEEYEEIEAANDAEPVIIGAEEGIVVYATRRMASSGSANLQVGKRVGYPANLGNYSTHYYYVNGKIAYCLESMKTGPGSGGYGAEVLEGNANLQKALYYGYGGAGDLTDQFMPQFDADLKYVFTHLAASYFYCGTDAFLGCSMEAIQACGVWGYIEFLASQPAPIDPYLSLSKSNLTASYDGTKQVTDRVTLHGDARNYITLTIPAGVTYHNSNTGETRTGGSVNIYGGTTFYFTAPVTVTNDWNTGQMYGNAGTVWKALVVRTGDGTQDIGSFYEESQSSSVSFFVDWLELAWVEVNKVDSKVADARLAGAVFGIYKDQACTQLITRMPATNASGYAKTAIAKTQDVVYLKEITAPRGYRRNTTAYNVTLIANETTAVTVPDVEQMAELTIYKEGEVLTGADVGNDGVSFQYGKKRLSHAVYNLYAGENIYTGYGALVFGKGELIRENLTTDENGLITVKNLHLGTYQIEEVQAPENYVLNDTKKTVVLSYGGQDVEVVFGTATFTNDRQKARVSVVKQDKDTLNPLDGGVFGLYAGEEITADNGTVVVPTGTLIETVTTGEDGSAAFSADLPIGFSYQIREIQAPYGYYRNREEVYSFSFAYTNSKEAVVAFSHSFSNDRVNAAIKLVKKYKETGVAQGDAKLEGAVYGLYAREDIVHPDGATGVIYRAGEQVTTLTTDSKGEATAENLYLGKYYVKEISPSEGYLIDEAEYDLHCSYEGDLVATVERSCTSLEQVKKQPFQMIKVSDNGEDTEAPVLENAGFTAYLKSSLSVGEDGGYDFASATPVVIGENGATEIFSDERGHVVSIAIPYGTYVVVESTTPHNREAIQPFEVNITENKPAMPQIWRVFLDREFTAKLRIVKKDADTGRAVLLPGTEFKIYNLDTNEYVEMITTYPSKVTHTSFFTDEDGDLILPTALKLGNYRIEEVAAPYGYVVNENYITVAVDTNTFYEVDPETYEAIITVDYADEPVVGELTVEKKGEVLDAYKGSLFAGSREKEFIYKEDFLAGAKFEVYAAEDIFTADMQVDENGNRTKYYSAGDLVATLVTGEDGKATLSDLPLGSYKVVEVEAPYGYVLNKEEQVVTFAYVDDKTPVIQRKVAFTNTRQKVDLSVVKMDGETGAHILGAEFGLYASEDILNVDGRVIVEKDTLLEVAVSDANGDIQFVKDYPLGIYYAKEIKAPAGYVSCDDIIEFDARYQGQEVEYATSFTTFHNMPTTFEFTKVDITSGAELSGATLTVLDEKGNVMDTWTSKTGEAHVIKKLEVGKTYVLHEEFAPYGYLQATDISFTVEDTEEIQTVVMKDEVPTGIIMINKDGEFLTDIKLIKEHWYDFVFAYFRKSLAGVTFEVYAAEDIVSPDGLDTVYYEKDTLVAKIVTNDEGIASIENLPLGKYYLMETKTLEGFVLDSEPIMADLSYVDQDTKVVYAGMEVTNERQKVQVTVIKTDAETKKELEGAIFGLYAAEDIVNADGKVIVKKDTLVEKAVTGTDGKCVFVSDLPLGKYYVKEIEAPKGHVLNEEIFALDASYQGDEVKVIELEAAFVNYPTKLEISKTDITGEYELKGATLSIIDKSGNVVETWKSDGETHYIERIPVGEYVLREEAAPYGYKIANEVKFTVENTKEIQKVSMKDELVSGKIIIKKTDEVTDKGIAGVEFEIRDKDGKVIETLVTDKGGHAESKELTIAVFKDGNFVEDMKYYVVETKAAEGYILDSTPHEIVLRYDGEAPEVVTYTLSLTNKPTEPKLPQTGDNMNPWLFAGVGFVMIVIGVVLVINVKRNRNR